jgi:hypothetical protein
MSSTNMLYLGCRGEFATESLDRLADRASARFAPRELTLGIGLSVVQELVETAFGKRDLRVRAATALEHVLRERAHGRELRFHLSCEAASVRHDDDLPGTTDPRKQMDQPLLVALERRGYFGSSALPPNRRRAKGLSRKGYVDLGRIFLLSGDFDCGEVDDGARLQRRWLAHPRLVVGSHHAVVAAGAVASAGLPSPARARPRRDERDLSGAQDRHAVERAERHRCVHVELCAPALSGVGAGRRLS